MSKLNHSGDRYPQQGGKKLAWISAVSTSRKLLLRLEETSEIYGLTVNSIETTTNVSTVN